MTTIGFLHTAAVHEATFESLLDELAPDAVAVHVTDPSLLDDARARGSVDAELEHRILAALRAASADADAVVCTCSTIAGAAESLAGQVGVRVVRIDRPMIEAAVATGPRLAVVAALESTVAPTVALVDQVAAAAGVDVVTAVVTCTGAWDHFTAGDLRAYHATIAAAVDALDTGSDDGLDAIVLAQASMAGAIPLATTRIPILASPRLAVAAALATG